MSSPTLLHVFTFFRFSISSLLSIRKSIFMQFVAISLQAAANASYAIVIHTAANLLPFLHDHAPTLEFSQVTQRDCLVLQLFAWERRHQHPRSALARWRRRVDESVDVPYCVRGVEARYQTRAVAEPDLQRKRGLRLVDLDGMRRSRLSGCTAGGVIVVACHRSTGGGGRGASRPRGGTPQPLSAAREGLVLRLRRDVFLRVLHELDVDFLRGVHVHDVQRCAPLPDHGQVPGVGRVVGAVQRAVVDGEAVFPEVQAALDERGAARLGGGGVFDCAAFCVVAA